MSTTGLDRLDFVEYGYASSWSSLLIQIFAVFVGRIYGTPENRGRFRFLVLNVNLQRIFHPKFISVESRR